jgi:catechol 2,3-dioxygenase-like lactoylglutathione lyase family enzyme
MENAVRTDDMEATRRFYEDVLGMPMVAAMKESMDSTNGRKTPFLHCFFEIGDGGSLAFSNFSRTPTDLRTSCRQSRSIITLRCRSPTSTIWRS